MHLQVVVKACKKDEKLAVGLGEKLVEQMEHERVETTALERDNH